MKHPLALFLDVLRSGGALHAAASQGEAKSIAWLLGHNIYNVDCYYDNATALYEATLCNKPDSILTLLKYKAKPNLLSKNVVSLNNEKPIQNCINQADASSIKLLIMHGADDKGVRFILDRQDIETLFYKTLETKRQYDAYLKDAKTQLLSKQYSQALTNYLQAGNVWYVLSQNEPVALYQQYYQEQALTFYAKAILCYEKLSAVEFSRELKLACQQLFEKAADCCHWLKLADQAKAYSSQAAKLQTGLRRQSYSSNREDPQQTAYAEVGLYKRKPKRQDQKEEQQGLLDQAYIL